MENDVDIKNLIPVDTANRRNVKFPKRSLEDSLKISQKLKDLNGGNPWSPREVAKSVGYSPKTNEFYYLSASSRDYGLTVGTRDAGEIKLAELGRKIVYAGDYENELEYKRQAFFNIPIFTDVFDYYQGNNLPEIKYLSNTLESKFKLNPNFHNEFVEIFNKNCEYLELDDNHSSVNEETQEKSSTIIVGDPLLKTEKKLKLFVAIPFTENINNRPGGFFIEVMQSLIIPSGTTAGFQVATANRQGSDIIQSTIINEILNADLMLADLTDHNPNVLFELGLRIANNKPIVIIKARGTKNIFDVDNLMRYYEYNPNLWKSTIEKDTPKLTEHIKAAWDGVEKNPSYLSILTQDK